MVVDSLVVLMAALIPALALGGLARVALGRVRHAGRANAGAPAPPFAPITPAAFVSPNDQGAFGEALTHMILASEGWRPLNGKPGAGPQGIDGIYRKTGPTGWRALLVETKTNASTLKPRQMQREKLLADLDTLFVTAGDPLHQAIYAELHAALSSDDPRLSLALWRHHLALGVTEQQPLGVDGAPVGKPTRRDTAAMMEGLAASLDEIDRKHVYWAGV
jgi:hypothetical protein